MCLNKYKDLLISYFFRKKKANIFIKFAHCLYIILLLLCKPWNLVYNCFYIVSQYILTQNFILKLGYLALTSFILGIQNKNSKKSQNLLIILIL